MMPLRLSRGVLLSFLALLIAGEESLAQASLFLVDAETRVHRIRWQGQRVFEDDVLSDQLVTAAPGWFDRMAFWRNRRYPFSPVELQKDVARLRRFYARNGFLNPDVDYTASLDSARNRIDITFAMDAGSPLQIQSVDFIGVDGRAAYYQFEESARPKWVDFRTRNTTVKIGDRFSRPEVLRIEDRALEWLSNEGYAFSRIDSRIEIDSTYNLVDIQYVLDPGPLAHIRQVRIERIGGERSLRRRVVQRELPFESGDRFSRSALLSGQRHLFGLNLFRIAIVDVPPQPRDSLVDIRVRIQQAKLRSAKAETGYARDEGLRLQGEFGHRNFLKGARLLTVSGVLATGIGALRRDDLIEETRRRAAVTLRQPYIMRSGLSALWSAFVDRSVNSVTREREIGFTSTAILEIFPFRTLSVQHSFSRVAPIEQSDFDETFTRSVLSATGAFGRADDYLNPTSGYLIRPAVEFASSFLASDTEYIKGGLSVSGYARVSRRASVAARLYGGVVEPIGGQTNTGVLEDARFNTIRFYGGGSNDVRGWGTNALGPKTTVRDTLTMPEYRYQPAGGLSKFSGNAEFRFAVPRLGSSWQSALFLDFGKIGDDHARFGSGLGLRYKTPIGFIRIDGAVKLNPSAEDLRSAQSVLEAGSVEAADPHFRRRLRLHVSIGHLF